MGGLTRRSFAAAALTIAGLPALAKAAAPPGRIEVAPGVSLHYIERGAGVPIVFVHGSLADYSYWDDQVAYFGESYHAVAYSRRFSPPNHNPSIKGYSALVDAVDLAGVIERLGLERAHIVGHSYGALTALFLGLSRPELVRTLTLCEPPAMSLLDHITGSEATAGKIMLRDVNTHMVAPMIAAFKRGDVEDGVRTFVNYVHDDPEAWSKLGDDGRAEALAGSREFQVILTSGTFFPEVPLVELGNLHRPCLMLSGSRSYRFLALTDAELARRLPDCRHVILEGASHGMWYEQPKECQEQVAAFLQAHA